MGTLVVVRQKENEKEDLLNFVCVFLSPIILLNGM